METATIYVKLLDEGTDVWRPVTALALQDGSFELIEPPEQQPHQAVKHKPRHH